MSPDLMATAMSGGSGEFSIEHRRHTGDQRRPLRASRRRTRSDRRGAGCAPGACSSIKARITRRRARSVRRSRSRVQSGEDRSGVDVALKLVPSVTISGRLMGPTGTGRELHAPSHADRHGRDVHRSRRRDDHHRRRWLVHVPRRARGPIRDSDAARAAARDDGRGDDGDQSGRRQHVVHDDDGRRGEPRRRPPTEHASRRSGRPRRSRSAAKTCAI